MISSPTSAVTTATRCSCAQFRTNALKKRVVGGSSTKFDRRKKAPLRQNRMWTTTEAKKKNADDMESAEKSIKAPSIPSVADSQDEDIDSCAFVLCSVDNDQFEEHPGGP